MAWIKSQDKTMLLDINFIKVNTYSDLTKPNYAIETYLNGFGWIKLGMYSTEVKMLNVVYLIQKYIGGKTKYYISQDIGNPNGYHVLDDKNIPMCYCDNGIFEMPADNEV